MRHLIIYVYAGLCLAVVAFLVIVACRTEDLHYMNRAGASVAALSALFIVAQMYLEYADSSNASSQRRKILGLRNSLQEHAAMQPHSANAILSAELHKLEKDLLHRRLAIAGLVAAFTFVGEALHGWGDLLLEVLCR